MRACVCVFISVSVVNICMFKECVLDLGPVRVRRSKYPLLLLIGIM